jgi:protein-disulfide isomerase
MAKKKASIYKRKVQQQKQRQKQLNRYLSIGIAAVVVVALIIVSWPKPEAKPLTEARLESDPALGPSNAPVTIVEYGDFGCSSCKIWHQAGVRNQVEAEYGERVQFVWRDFPVITAQSPKAAEAGQCAFDQGMFWEFHDYVYEQGGSLGVSDLKEYAKQIGLDSKQFNNCLDSGQNKAKVDHDLNLAYRLGFPGTPGFVVNGQKLAGPPTYVTLKGIIDEILVAQ